MPSEPTYLPEKQTARYPGCQQPWSAHGKAQGPFKVEAAGALATIQERAARCRDALAPGMRMWMVENKTDSSKRGGQAPQRRTPTKEDS
jgi:hypothetical protein